MTLGRKIQKLRKDQGWTQEDLAERLGVSSQAVSKWETDMSSPDISILRDLAKTLRVTVDYLLSPEETVEPEVRLLSEANKKKLDDMILHLNVNSADGDVVRINLPMPLVRMALEIGMEMPKVKNREVLQQIDVEKVLMLASKGVVGKLLEVHSADNDIVEIVVE